MRLPAKSVCRFRAVCTAWHSLLCHLDFIAAAQPGPRIAVGLCHDGPRDVVVSVLDMDSGHILNRVSIDVTSRHSTPPPHETPDVSPERAVCVVGNDGRLHLIDPATSAVKLLPDPPSSNHMSTSCTLGYAALTGEYKVIAIANAAKHTWQQICKILTLNDNGGEQRWRETESPGYSLLAPLPPWTYSREVAVVEGVAYFLVKPDDTLDVQHAWIMAFDLGNEVWQPDALQGPECKYNVALATLEGKLVVCHDNRQTSMELWFLVDPDQAQWCMRHKIVMPSLKLSSPMPTSGMYFGKPLAGLDDRTIVMWMRVTPTGCSIPLDTVLRYYDPRTRAFTDGMQVAKCSHVTVHTWSILYSGRGGIRRASLES
ncbi:putative F-box protein At3g52320 [Aegilops tauschii subsp. strangulata]|uniref:putative F-box protein At3g52320 n=1 Tax=Aegilops tauschii subsp. strangulata TaxID=200361 RepID=UPI003CC863B3